MKNLKLKTKIWEDGLTQNYVARKTRVPPEHLSMSINGKFILPIEQRKRIADFLGVPEEELFVVEHHVEKVAKNLGVELGI
jgi:transcriptional regulator with XRE-family HTH domain